MQHQSYNLSKWALAGIALCSFILLYVFKWDSAESMSHIIDGDGRDYYSYLVSLFIDHNLGHQDVSLPYINATPTGTVNVHTAGEALLLLPFFAIACVWASAGHYDVSGYSAPFEYMVSTGALCYMLMGLFFIRKLLKHLNIKDGIIAAVLLLLFTGTNLLNYGLNEPSMSHVYSFALISAFLYCSCRLIDSQAPKYLYFSALVYGLILLLRPVNAVVLFVVPFWANSFADFIQCLKIIFTPSKKLFISAIIVLAVLSVQGILWIIQNGRLLQWTQKDDGFYFLNPHPFQMLFGFNSGFFIYVPLCFLVLAGLIPLYRQNRYKSIVLGLFLAGVVYLFSSHWAYTYFDGLGIRPLVEYYAIFALLGALLLTYLSGVKRTAISALFVLCVGLNLVYCYQFKTGILASSSMNYNKFRYIFLKTGAQYANTLGGCMDTPPYRKPQPAASFSHTEPFANDGNGYYAFKDNEFGVEYKIPTIGFNSNKLYVKVSLRRKEAQLNASAASLVALSVESPAHESKHFEAFKLNDAPPVNCCEWEQFDYAITLNGQFAPEDSLTVFLWNKGRQPFYVDDFKVEVYNYNREI